MAKRKKNSIFEETSLGTTKLGDKKSVLKEPGLSEFGNPFGRPRVVDKEMFERLCRVSFTVSQLQAAFACTYETLNNFAKDTYGETIGNVMKHFQAGMQANIVSKQYELAMNGSERMLIHLGVNYADQRKEPREVEQGGSMTINLVPMSREEAQAERERELEHDDTWADDGESDD